MEDLVTDAISELKDVCACLSVPAFKTEKAILEYRMSPRAPAWRRMNGCSASVCVCVCAEMSGLKPESAYL